MMKLTTIKTIIVWLYKSDLQKILTILINITKPEVKYQGMIDQMNKTKKLGKNFLTLPKRWMKLLQKYKVLLEKNNNAKKLK